MKLEIGSPQNAPAGESIDIQPNLTKGRSKPQPFNISGTPGAVIGSNQGVQNFDKYSQEKVAFESPALAWKGFVAELQKQGASEDFIMGMMKEAEEKAAFDGTHIMDKLKEVLKGSQMPDATGEAANRHPIIPGLANKWLGLAGGAGLGAMLGGEMDLDGPLGVAIPALGAAAGFHYLPQMMNRWKDAYGSGVNQVHPGTAALNRSNPLPLTGAAQ
jgi:hypothetical protein